MDSPAAEPENQAADLKTTASHQGYVLIGSAFFVFEMFFLVLYTNTFWFNVDLIWLGAPAALVAIGVAHLLLSLIESSFGCHFLSRIWRRRPAVVYRKWVKLNQAGLAPGITFGERHVVWSAIDSVELGFWGNLHFLSNALCGVSDHKATVKRAWYMPPSKATAEEVLKIPFGVGSIKNQKLLIQKLQEYRPDVKLNARLKKKLEAPELKGANYVQQLGAVFLFVVLLDVGQSMFNYLEMLKGYYLADQSARSEDKESNKKAAKFYAHAEELREHPLPFSWVSTKIVREGKISSGLFQDRADALWSMGRREEAIESQRKSLELAPSSFRLNLRLARLLQKAGHHKEAIEQVDEAIKNHESAFLPRLYLLALRPASERTRFFKIHLDELDDRVFVEQPAWPPGGETFLSDVWYRDDVTFIFDRLFQEKQTDQLRQEKKDR